MIRVGRDRYSTVLIPRRINSANGWRMERARIYGALSAYSGRPLIRSPYPLVKVVPCGVTSADVTYIAMSNIQSQPAPLLPHMAALRTKLRNAAKRTPEQDELLKELDTIDEVLNPSNPATKEIRTGLTKRGSNARIGPRPGTCDCCGK
jgi:hypothetical protein